MLRVNTLISALLSQNVGDSRVYSYCMMVQGILMCYGNLPLGARQNAIFQKRYLR